MIWTKLAMFLLAVFGLALNWLYVTWRKDSEDAKQEITPLDIIWKGAAKWKTILNIAFLGVVTILFPPAYLDSMVGACFGGVELGWGAPVLFGLLSEAIMLKVFKKRLGEATGKVTK